MQWVQITPDYVRSFCGRFVILQHYGEGWTLYDSDEFVQAFPDLLEAKLSAELMVTAGWDF